MQQYNWSQTMRRKRFWPRLLPVLFGLTALVAFLQAILYGPVFFPLKKVLYILLYPETDMASQIILNVRLPRAITGAMVGADLSLSGLILQAVLRNPLADPHLIGVSAGAGIVGMIVLIFLPQCIRLLPPLAFIGAIGTAVLIYVLAWKDGMRPVRIILAGVAVSAFLGACISGLLIFYNDRVHGALMWLIGGLGNAGWNDVTLLYPYTVAGIILTFAGSYYLNMLRLGDDMARGLGVAVERTRLLLLAVAALLAAGAVSVGGLIGFVGLVVPHIVKLLIGEDYRFVVPASVFLGSAVMLFSDTVARLLFAPVELPVGLIMALLGAPFFLFLLRKEV